MKETVDKVVLNAGPALAAFRRAEAALIASHRSRFDFRRVAWALTVLAGGLEIFDRWWSCPFPGFRQQALRSKCEALINHDRLLTGRTVE